MTVSDLLDQVYFDAGEPGSAFRTSARRWLNLVRSKIAEEGPWQAAFRPNVEFTTAASVTDGIYTLSDDSTGFDYVVSAQLYDVTNSTTIKFEPRGRVRSADPDPTTGPPTFWSDAGVDSNGFRQVALWPIPAAAYTIRYDGYLTLTDLTSADDNLSVDPFYGPISPWASTFVEGLRYYHDVNNNEDSAQVELQRRAFDVAIARRKAANRLSSTSPMASEVIRTQLHPQPGRFNPAHYSNR